LKFANTLGIINIISFDAFEDENFIPPWLKSSDGIAPLGNTAGIEKAGIISYRKWKALFDGNIKALLAFGDGRYISYYDMLPEIEFFAVMDLYLNELARYANIVLPGLAYFEKDGTFYGGKKILRKVPACAKNINILDRI
jgi:anaerobic selenocysteine-containing dehydrogenase